MPDNDDSSNPLDQLMGEMLKWMEDEADRLCKKYNLNKDEVLKMTEGKSFDEFSDLLDKMIEEKNNSIN